MKMGVWDVRGGGGWERSSTVRSCSLERETLWLVAGNLTLMDRAVRVLSHLYQTVFNQIKTELSVKTGTNQQMQSSTAVSTASFPKPRQFKVMLRNSLTTASSCMEDRCLGCLGASTEISQPLDSETLPWLAIPATQPWAHKGPVTLS